MKNLLVLLLSISMLSAAACDITGITGFAPENDLNIPADVKSVNGIDEATFNQVIDEVEAVYAPIVKERLNKKLQVKRKWQDGTVNASASQMFSFLTRKIVVNMYGGLARHEKITRDGFAVVLCHEMGHHLAGSPRVPGLLGKRWAANEGQSDYFATLKCFRKVYGSDDNESIIASMKVPATVRKSCESVYKSNSEIALCIRSTMAGQSTANLLSVLRKSPEPKIDTPDQAIVKKTFDAHPAGQCRLDTYFAGALCDKDMNISTDMKDPTIGTCNRSNGETIGIRPLCWFAPAS